MFGFSCKSILLKYIIYTYIECARRRNDYILFKFVLVSNAGLLKRLHAPDLNEKYLQLKKDILHARMHTY